MTNISKHKFSSRVLIVGLTAAMLSACIGRDAAMETTGRLKESTSYAKVRVQNLTEYQAATVKSYAAMHGHFLNSLTQLNSQLCTAAYQSKRAELYSAKDQARAGVYQAFHARLDKSPSLTEAVSQALSPIESELVRQIKIAQAQGGTTADKLVAGQYAAKVTTALNAEYKKLQRDGFIQGLTLLQDHAKAMEAKIDAYTASQEQVLKKIYDTCVTDTSLVDSVSDKIGPPITGIDDKYQEMANYITAVENVSVALERYFETNSLLDDKGLVKSFLVASLGKVTSVIGITPKEEREGLSGGVDQKANLDKAFKDVLSLVRGSAATGFDGFDYQSFLTDAGVGNVGQAMKDRLKSYQTDLLGKAKDWVLGLVK